VILAAVRSRGLECVNLRLNNKESLLSFQGLPLEWVVSITIHNGRVSVLTPVSWNFYDGKQKRQFVAVAIPVRTRLH
jgi:hypothetical protein